MKLCDGKVFTAFCLFCFCRSRQTTRIQLKHERKIERRTRTTLHSWQLIFHLDSPSVHIKKKEKRNERKQAALFWASVCVYFWTSPIRGCAYATFAPLCTSQRLAVPKAPIIWDKPRGKSSRIKLKWRKSSKHPMKGTVKYSTIALSGLPCSIYFI